MEQNLELLKKMEENSRKQLNYARIQCLFSILAAVCCIALLVVVLHMLPTVQGIAQQAEVILADLETATHNLAKIDLTGTIDNVNALLTTSQSGVEEAMEKINAIDFETLNSAIEDLADIIKPLADVSNLFK